MGEDEVFIKGYFTDTVNRDIERFSKMAHEPRARTPEGKLARVMKMTRVLIGERLRSLGK